MTAQFAYASDACTYAATALYVVAMALFAAYRSVRKAAPAPQRVLTTVGGGPATAAEEETRRPAGDRLGRMAIAATGLAAAVHAVALVGRWWAAGHAPWANMYEFALALVLVTVLAYLVALRKYPEAMGIGLLVTGLAGLALTASLTYLHVEPGIETVPALRSNWLLIHVFAAFLAGGIFTLGAMISLAFMYADAHDKQSAPRLDRLARRLHDVAFPIWTFAVIAGAIWAEAAWGRYWAWDPKETSSLITWILYAAYLHARATRGWPSRRVAKVAILAWISLVFNFCWINLVVSGLHSYSGL